MSSLSHPPGSVSAFRRLAGMRALDQEVKDAVWAATEPLLPQRENSHPLGTHRRRVPDRLCFEGILVRLVTGCSWQTAERLLGCAVDAAGAPRRSPPASSWSKKRGGHDRGPGPHRSAVDGSAHKAPSGGPGTGRNPTDRGKSGWKWCSPTGPAGGLGRRRRQPPRPGPVPDRRRPRPVEDIETLHLTTAPRSGPATGASTTSSAPADDHAAPRTKPPPHSSMAPGPTRGCRTSDNSAATPTGTPTTDSPNSPSSSYSSDRLATAAIR